MAEAFLKILDIGITASYLIGAIYILRLLLKKVPKTFFYILWCIVGIRLMFPVSITGSFSLVPDTGIEAYSEAIMNSGDTSKADNAVSEEDANNSGVVNNAGSIDATDIVDNSGSVNNTDNNLGDENLQDNSAGITDKQEGLLVKVVAIVWALGVAVMAAYLCISSLLLKRRLAQAVPLRENIYQSDRIKSSFVFGVFRPSVYLPFSLGEDDTDYVIAHEKMHIRHRDYLVKIISFLVLSVYWFLPTVWVAWVLFCRDMEAFCDESVIKELGQEEKKNYATALLNCAERKEKLPVCPVAFGGAGMKERIKNVLNYKKASFWVVVLLVLIAIVLVVCFVPSRKKIDSEDSSGAVNTEQDETEEIEMDTLSAEIPEETTEEYIEPIVWYEDLTHDGNDERIVVDINDIDTMSDPEARQVKVHSGVDDSLIWSGQAKLVHVAENGYYLYKNPEDGKAYILRWHPYTNNDQSEYSYKLFSLTEAGQEKVFKEETIEFSFVEPKDKDALNVSYYLEGVNELLAESYVLIDTCNWDLFYSEQDTPVTREFDIEKVIEYIYEGTEIQESLNGKHITWYEDLTHDGVDERIVVDINHLDVNGEDAGWLPYYEPQTVMVYSGQTYRLIWTGYVDLVHVGWDGFYIYTDPVDGKAYILQWQPYLSTGMADYNHRVFYLSETGEENILDKGYYSFLRDRPEADDPENVRIYLDRVNEFLRNSYVLIDTDNGNAFYSEVGVPVTREFDTEEEVRWINYFLSSEEEN